jgi:hypothetical protein
MSPLMINKGGPFYLWNMTGLTLYWEMQINYIEAEINRMKMKSVIKIKDFTIKLTGFHM